MNDNIKKIIDQVGTDCSGKWISTSDAPQIFELAVKDVLSLVEEPAVREKICQHFGVKL